MTPPFFVYNCNKVILFWMCLGFTTRCID